LKIFCNLDQIIRSGVNGSTQEHIFSRCFITRSVLEKIAPDSLLRSFFNGQEFYDYFENGNDTMPDLVFLDLSMPDLSGFELLDKLRENTELSFKPKFVILTTSKYVIDKEKAKHYDEIVGFCEKHLTQQKFSELIKALN